MFKVGDLVYVSNPDTEYEKEYGERTHRSFFGTVTDVTEYTDEICVEVKFPATPNGCAMEWSYDANELSLAKKLKDMTIEELSNKFNLQIFAEYLLTDGCVISADVEAVRKWFHEYKLVFESSEE